MEQRVAGRCQRAPREPGHHRGRSTRLRLHHFLAAAARLPHREGAELIRLEADWKAPKVDKLPFRRTAPTS